MGLFDFFKKEEPIRKEWGISFYSVVGKNGDGIAQKIVEYFGEEVESAFDVHRNFVDETVLEYFAGEDAEKEIPIQDWTRTFTINLKDGTKIFGEIEENKEIGPKMANYFLDSNIKNEDLKKRIIYQICIFNCGVHFKIGFDYYKNKKTQMIKFYQKMVGMGNSFNGFEFDEDKLFHPNRSILIHKNGETDFEDFKPFIPAELIDNFEMTEEDKKRMARSIEKLKEENLPFLENMHVSISEANATIPEKELIIKRAVAMLITGIASEVYNEFGRDSEEARTGISRFMEMFEEKYGFKEVLNEREKTYLETYIEDDREHNEFNWRYECPPVFLWALSLQEMTDLSTICDFRGIIEFMRNNDMKSLLEKSKLRTKDEIMDMLDYLYRVNWSAVNIRVYPEEMKGYTFPYDESIVHFRRLALEWLVQPEKNIEDVENELHT